MTVSKKGDTPKDIAPQDATPITDPMTAFFGQPGAGTPDLVTPEDDMPEDIRALFDSEGLFKKSYTCTLKELPGGLDDGLDLYLASFRRTFPTIEYLTNHYGPGTYKLVFFWNGTDDETGLKKKKTDSTILRISDKAHETHKNFQRLLRIKKAKEHNEELRGARIEKQLEDDLDDTFISGKKDEKQSAKEYLTELTSTARDLGLSKPGTDWGSILASLAPFALPLMTMLSDRRRAEQERSDRQMQMLIGIMSGNSTQMLDLVKSQNNNSSSSEIMKEMTTMIMSGLDLKSAMEGQKESVSDKIFGLIESVAPAIMAMASQPRVVQQANPMAQMAKTYMNNDPNFKQMDADPEILADVIAKLDAFYGWEQTDTILTVGGRIRPPDCERKTGQQYPTGDPRNDEAIEHEKTASRASEAEFSEVNPK